MKRDVDSGGEVQEYHVLPLFPKLGLTAGGASKKHCKSYGRREVHVAASEVC